MEFSFSNTSCQTKVKESIRQYDLPKVEVGIWLHIFPKGIRLKGNESNLIQDLNLGHHSISYDDNLNAERDSWILVVVVISFRFILEN